MEPAPELCALIQRYYAASAQGEVAFLPEFVSPSPDALLIGTDGEEWWEGGENIARTWGEAWSRRGSMPIEASQPSAFRSGDMGWLTDRASWRLPDGRLVPFRLTAVFERGAGGWRMVHAHFSLGVPNSRFGE